MAHTTFNSTSDLSKYATNQVKGGYHFILSYNTNNMFKPVKGRGGGGGEK